MSKNVLMVVTSHSHIDDGKTTGIWLSEFAEAYTLFNEQGWDVVVASPLGGKAPVDPASLGEEMDPSFAEAAKRLENTMKLNDLSHERFDAIFLPGGHGAMYDLPTDQKLQSLLRDFYESGKVVAAVCHGPAALVGTVLSDGSPLVAGKRVNAFTDREEEETGLASHLPFLLERRLRELGAIFVAAPNWTAHYEADGNLITGQNPQSTIAVTNAVIDHLRRGGTSS
ncbi:MULTISPECIES: type 1 glutamine amidotransferase domain-containing protein [Bacillales]|jgi:putative intracellular protease/amidase|uniref:Glutamine amidotransferase n=1 Tax=Brevibacillus aydinogluensis TaxID=927786 RepID=A0AA48MCQ9_9BACL|nr:MULTISPECIES: type 1 glutamine amidotransferase domain-containing protein [Bacillales]REK65619.1 MAG: glutamine amidotransferase [Brevibacillus sp.]MBR8661802.1 type 1 glutamine amidotransferase domain-containing protein [Brevibacillus sp. NL20B1]MDT3418074.1 putative intracellular protease/amidase [Brevibacillus aydinogluensis]NNV04559.1 type 1 glutamine amidotransferase domain-containing protein [Brevibacillus sp. MCWH]UFJ62469.1 type 1 glutamine amidotransferase domain-containing protein